MNFVLSCLVSVKLYFTVVLFSFQIFFTNLSIFDLALTGVVLLSLFYPRTFGYQPS